MGTCQSPRSYSLAPYCSRPSGAPYGTSLFNFLPRRCSHILVLSYVFFHLTVTLYTIFQILSRTFLKVSELFSAAWSVIFPYLVYTYYHIREAITIDKMHKITGKFLYKLHNKKYLTKWAAVWYNGIRRSCGEDQPHSRRP